MSRSACMAALGVVAALALVGVALSGGAAAQSSDVVTITIKLQDQDGDGIGNADLTLSWDGGQKKGTTLSNGQRSFDVPKDATLAVRMKHDTYIRNHPYVIAEAAEQTYTIEASRSGTLSVTVRGDAGPIGDAGVQLFRSGRTATTGTTGGSGQVSLGPVEQGTYGLKVTKAGYYSNTTNVDVGASSSKTVRIRPGAVQLRVNVTDDHFSPPQPVQNARVTIEELGNTLTTLEGGDQTTSVPVNRVYTIEVTKPGYGTTSSRVRVGESSERVSFAIQRNPSLSLSLENDRVVVGETTDVRVTNEYGEAAEGVPITVDGSQVGTTNNQGVLEVTIEQAGNLTVEASQGGLSDSGVVEGIEPGRAVTTAPPTTTTQPPTTTTTVVTTTVTTEEPTTTTSEGGPGFTAFVALVAVLSTAAIAARRR